MLVSFRGKLPVHGYHYAWSPDPRGDESEMVLEPTGPVARIVDPFADDRFDAMFLSFAKIADLDENLPRWECLADRVLYFALDFGAQLFAADDPAATARRWISATWSVQNLVEIWQGHRKYAKRLEPESEFDIEDFMGEPASFARGRGAMRNLDSFVLAAVSAKFPPSRLSFAAGSSISKGRQRRKLVHPSATVACDGIWQCVLAQFAEAVAEQYEFAECTRCSRPFRQKYNREFCSDSCRVGEYKRRRADAIKLHQRGKTAKQIAKLLGIADVETIRGWIE